MIRLHCTYTEMVKKKRARAHTGLIAKARNNFACDLQDPIERGIKMVPLESIDILWIRKRFGLNLVRTYIFYCAN